DAAAARALDDLFASAPSSTDTAQPAGDASRPFGLEFSRPNPRGRSRPIGLQFEDMAMPDGIASPSLANKPSAASLAAAQAAAFESYPRLNPTYGRSVELDNARGRDIVRGIGMLGSLMARNKIRADFNKQRFHERGGLKRKRLNSERWRARFKKGFQDVTGRVVELTRKGW
ncbi:ribosomal protein s21, partial [Stagonosporopsis vannaccii]